MNLTEFAKEIHQNAIEHGWWDEPRRFGEVIALCHSELSEALEEYRAGRPMENMWTTLKRAKGSPIQRNSIGANRRESP